MDVYMERDLHGQRAKRWKVYIWGPKELWCECKVQEGFMGAQNREVIKVLVTQAWELTCDSVKLSQGDES